MLLLLLKKHFDIFLKLLIRLPKFKKEVRNIMDGVLPTFIAKYFSECNESPCWSNCSDVFLSKGGTKQESCHVNNEANKEVSRIGRSISFTCLPDTWRRVESFNDITYHSTSHTSTPARKLNKYEDYN